ncbi:unnamed protein product [Diatraea saccharalis]|uniref:ZAD domain-containing protein n=1 Tax=Diatraea saccharalis TaxID=40085 RepID=A0A9P0G3E2_9NEOP|nr:unnamed protein product [Diatraea saccharalis]
MEAFIFLFAKCRLCLERPGVINLFGSGNEDLPEDVYLCTGLRVHPSDNFPQKICNECIGIIHEAKKLRVRAFKNDTHLRTLFMVDGVKKDNSVSN